jgi:transcriptional regulator with XRE-family HTH domain
VRWLAFREALCACGKMAEVLRGAPPLDMRCSRPLGEGWGCPHPRSTYRDDFYACVWKVTMTSSSDDISRIRHVHNVPYAAWFKGLRKTLGKSQNDVAQQIGVKHQSVRRWECGIRLPSRPTRHLLNDWARSVGYPPIAPPRKKRRKPVVVLELPETWRERDDEQEAR